MENNNQLTYPPLAPQNGHAYPAVYQSRPFVPAPVAQMGTEEGSLTAGSVLAAFKRWFWIATPIGVLLSVGAAALVWYYSTPTYRAIAWLGLEGTTHSYIAFPQDREGYKTNPFIQTQIELLRSPLVLDQAVLDPALQDVPPIRDSSEPATYLSKKLGVEAVRLSELIQVSMETSSAEWSAKIVNAVVKAYIEYQEKQGMARNLRIIELLEKERERRRAELTELQRKFFIMAKASGHNLLVGGSKQELGLAKNSAETLEEKLAETEVDREVLSARIRALEESIGKEKLQAPANIVEQTLDANPHLGELNALLARKRASLAQASIVSNNKKNDPVVVNLHREIDDLERQIAAVRNNMRPEAAKLVQSSLSDQRVDQLAEMKAELQGFKVLETNLKSQIEAQRRKLGEGDDAWRLQLAKADVERAEEVLGRISTRAEALRTEVQAPAQVNVLRPATPPKLPEGASPNVKIAAAGLGAFTLPFLCVLLLERRAKRITEPMHIVQEANVPVVGEVTRLRLSTLDNRRGLLAPSNRLCNAFDESVEYVRTRLLSRDDLRDMQVIAVASAVSGEGKTRLAAHLATSVARSNHARTLVIDADLRNPDLHQLFRAPVGPGLSDVLAGQAEWTSAVTPTNVEGLDILPAGATKISPHVLLSNGRLETLMHELRGVYQYIVVDCPPVLLVSDTLIIAKAADGAVLCTMHNHSRGPDVRSAYERLENAGARVLGAVLSGVAPKTYVYPHRN